MSDGKVVVKNNGGLGFIGFLTLIFITLKLTGYINWSWIWVLSPIWIYISFILLITVFVALVVFILATRQPKVKK